MNKNRFTKYLLKLVTYANLQGIKVQFKENTEDRFIPSKNLIIIEGDIEDYNEELLIALLHELGHVYDDQRQTPKDIKKCNQTYPRIYAKNPPMRIIKNALMFERRAWRYGKLIAKNLGITLTKMYKQQQEECLLAYGKTEY